MKTDLNKLIASLLSTLLSTAGAVMFFVGAVIGYLIAKSIILFLGLVAILVIVLFVFRDKISLKKISENMRKTPVAKEVPSSQSEKTDVSSSEKKEEKKKRIVIELE